MKILIAAALFFVLAVITISEATHKQIRLKCLINISIAEELSLQSEFIRTTQRLINQLKTKSYLTEQKDQQDHATEQR
jgi:dethiobiotin synthetase